jgi:hypothetical protein
MLQIRIRDLVHFYPKDPVSGSGIRDDFFSGSRFLDPYHVPISIYLQDFTFKNGEKQENLILFKTWLPIMTYSCMKKGYFSLLIFVGSESGIRIQDKRRSDPDPGYQKMIGSGSGKLFDEKNQRSKISWNCLFKIWFLGPNTYTY